MYRFTNPQTIQLILAVLMLLLLLMAGGAPSGHNT